MRPFVFQRLMLVGDCKDDGRNEEVEMGSMRAEE